jgi:type II secretory pathway predicted ATPase ExeA
MFLEFYKLREQPFGVTPDPRFLYFGSAHREALASLLYSVETKRGFSALVAEPGMGKTSLLFQMLNSLRNSARTAFLFQNHGDSRELLCSLLHDLGISVTSQDPVAMRDALNEGLLQELHAGKKVVVVIDEAQNLDEKVLETVRLLSNFETSTQKLMHIVLAGQLGLAAKLSETGMMQLRQRVSTIIRLEPFRHDEIVAYIEHRLRTAGHKGPNIFSADALEMIARISQGIPRNINSLCFQALSIGFATQSKIIGADILREVASDLDFTPRRYDRPIPRAPTSWPPPHLEPPPVTATTRHAMLAYASPMPPRPSRLKWVAALTCFAIVPTVIIALSDSKLGLTETIPGRASTQVVNAVLSSSDSNADFVPAWPNKLKPPPPPPGAEMLTNTSTVSSSEEQVVSSLVNASKTNEIIDGPKRVQYTPSIGANRIHGTAAVPEKGKRFDGTGDEPNRSGIGNHGAPKRVQVLRSESLFQFALEVYGQSNWNIIEAICAANPQIRGPYSVLSVGEWIQLPSDLVTVTAKYNTHETMGRVR